MTKRCGADRASRLFGMLQCTEIGLTHACGSLGGIKSKYPIHKYCRWTARGHSESSVIAVRMSSSR